MNGRTTQDTQGRRVQTIRAWPHRGRTISLNKDEVRQKVTSTLEAGLDLQPGQIADDTLIKRDLDADFYKLGGPIMIIENYFRTLLQNELDRDDMSIRSIVARLMSQTDRESICTTDEDLAHAA